eukprot:TRINITY_DN1283_c0_g1_i1.p1 TRINITY_DN1283_c0_g1~~TRINITY_DN1283_c0_g1_i1.p1  ORF type:complete len:162 (+),score=49.01 TRINITY_DN1283_c0_g1_i1:40-525(+)
MKLLPCVFLFSLLFITVLTSITINGERQILDQECVTKDDCNSTDLCLIPNCEENICVYSHIDCENGCNSTTGECLQNTDDESSNKEKDDDETSDGILQFIWDNAVSFSVVIAVAFCVFCNIFSIFVAVYHCKFNKPKAVTADFHTLVDEEEEDDENDLFSL